ncbi:tetratricopeptide repeat protein [Myxococcota bacterium]|nr:tetratricopeptide repeat protein [Myxococcota bacterium]
MLSPKLNAFLILFVSAACTTPAPSGDTADKTGTDLKTEKTVEVPEVKKVVPTKTLAEILKTKDVSMAVAPFVTANPKDAWIGVALADSINGRIFFSKGMIPYTTRQIAAAQHQAQLGGKSTDIVKGALILGRHLGAALVMVGDYELKKDKINIKISLVEMQNGDVVGSDELSMPLSDLKKAEIQIAGHLLSEIHIKVTQDRALIARPASVVKAVSEAMMILRQQSLSPKTADPTAPLQVTPEKLKEARVLLESALETIPGDEQALSALALILAMGEDTKGAEKELKKIKLEGALPAPFTLLSRTFVQMRKGDFEKAEAYLRRAISDHPQFIHARGSFAEMLLHFGRLREARSEYKKYLEVLPQQPWVIAQMGYCNAKLGKVDQAIKDSQKAVALIPESVYFLNELASRYIDADQLKPAEETLMEVLKKSPNNIRAHVRLGYVRLLRENYAASVEVSEKALKLAKGPRYKRDRAYAHLNIARALGRDAKIDEAIEHLKKAKAESDVSIDELELDPALDKLRQDPRYRLLIE